MSHKTVLYGRILGTHGTTDNWYELYSSNKNIIDSLPDEDEFPVILKSMFVSPPALAGPTLYHDQVNVFGASFKNIDHLDHRCWISKFEDLLKQLYWFDVVIHFDIELYGRFEHRWKATEKAILDMRTLKPKSISDWIYSEKEL